MGSQLNQVCDMKIDTFWRIVALKLAQNFLKTKMV